MTDAGFVQYSSTDQMFLEGLINSDAKVSADAPPAELDACIGRYWSVANGIGSGRIC